MFDTTETLAATFGRYADHPDRIENFYRFRYNLFVKTLGWQLDTEPGREIDQFDHSSAEYCVVTENDKIIAGFRAVRTDHDYLAAKIFPNLATTRDYPRRADIWEISRFGIAPHLAGTDVAKINYSLMMRFARHRNATALVALADLVYERYLRTLGIRTRRYGPPQVIGTNTQGRKLRCVAGEIPLPDQVKGRVDTLIAYTEQMDIEDAALVFGHSAISA
ncbi:MAG: GNAT family N-acetyltransferase [Alphaproteobacteria bacterium]|nr:GNAT family N-acetyltransferase [Alphaproteobacteria bacterium]